MDDLKSQFINETGNKIPLSKYQFDWFVKYSDWLESKIKNLGEPSDSAGEPLNRCCAQSASTKKNKIWSFKEIHDWLVDCYVELGNDNGNGGDEGKDQLSFIINELKKQI